MSKTAYHLTFIGVYLCLLILFVIAGNVFAGKLYNTFVTVLLSIFLEAVPFLLAGSLMSGLIHVFVDQELLFRIVPRHPLLGSFLGAVAGLVFPVCECGVIPVTRRLYQKGLPLSPGIAFILAAPIINPIVIASTYTALGWGPMLWYRLSLSFLIASIIGYLFSYAAAEDILIDEVGSSKEVSEDLFAPASTIDPVRVHFPETGDNSHGGVCCVNKHASHAGISFKERLYDALAIAGDDFLDMLRYLLAGAIVAAGMQTLIPQSVLMTFNTNAALSVLTMMLLAFLLSVCSTADAFLALAFTKSFTLPSVLAFLVFGPMIDMKSLLMLLRIFRPRSVFYLVLLAGMMVLTVTTCLNLQGQW